MNDPDTSLSPRPGLSAFRRRFAFVVLLYGILTGTSLATRAVLTVVSSGSVDCSPAGLLGAFGLGSILDLIAAAYVTIPFTLYLALVPERLLVTRFHAWFGRVLVGACLFAVLFSAMAEVVFWDEFGVRFNFIAIDYLIYTREVLDNIVQSYPVGRMLGLLGVLAAAGLWALHRVGLLDGPGPGPVLRRRTRLAVAGVLLLPPVLWSLAVNDRELPRFTNAVNAELSRNGMYSFVTAFRDNELDYTRFYKTVEPALAFEQLRHLLDTEGASFVSTDPRDITRRIANPGAEKRFNVIQITVESLSSEFVGALGGTPGLTPELDRLAEEGLLFTNLHATGTRTTRGLEALTLSLPPTPGRSIVKRPDNEHLFTLGSVFQGRGYDTVFLYGGYGYFDNMNRFFSGNGYRVVDRASRPAESTTFATAWGACDEDLLDWTLEEADAAHAAGVPFFHFVMTTSNHRPYTFPPGRIDVAPGTRHAAVRYTDYAIGRFMREAARHPWFEDTLFVIVADHCAGSSGKDSLPVKRYEIPMVFYKPGFVKPGRVDTLCSQADYPPTLLATLGWSYTSRFLGRNVLAPHSDNRAFIGTYRKLGYMNDGQLAVLEPVLTPEVYSYDRLTGDLSAEDLPEGGIVDDAVAYYQAASYLYDNGLYLALDGAGISPTVIAERQAIPEVPKRFDRRQGRGASHAGAAHRGSARRSSRVRLTTERVK